MVRALRLHANISSSHTCVKCNPEMARRKIRFSWDDRRTHANTQTHTHMMPRMCAAHTWINQSVTITHKVRNTQSRNSPYLEDGGWQFDSTILKQAIPICFAPRVAHISLSAGLGSTVFYGKRTYSTLLYKLCFPDATCVENGNFACHSYSVMFVIVVIAAFKHSSCFHRLVEKATESKHHK